jgi:hypothetical protein
MQYPLAMVLSPYLILLIVCIALLFKTFTNTVFHYLMQLGLAVWSEGYDRIQVFQGVEGGEERGPGAAGCEPR